MSSKGVLRGLQSVPTNLCHNCLRHQVRKRFPKDVRRYASTSDHSKSLDPTEPAPPGEAIGGRPERTKHSRRVGERGEPIRGLRTMNYAPVRQFKPGPDARSSRPSHLKVRSNSLRDQRRAGTKAPIDPRFKDALTKLKTRGRVKAIAEHFGVNFNTVAFRLAHSTRLLLTEPDETYELGNNRAVVKWRVKKDLPEDFVKPIAQLLRDAFENRPAKKDPAQTSHTPNGSPGLIQNPEVAQTSLPTSNFLQALKRRSDPGVEKNQTPLPKPVTPPKALLDHTTAPASGVRKNVSSVKSLNIPDDAPRPPLKRRGRGADTAATKIETANAEDFEVVHLDVPQPPIPTLAHDLQRVLFNPGVYQLQEIRTKVFNFDPYLQNLMSVSDFNFKALKDYVVSSEDTALRDLATKHEAKYYGSTSSMTAVLGHFHFLLSQWRSPKVLNLSEGYTEPSKSFTSFNKRPVGVFLRYKDGAYAIDADKENDSANILMELGKSVEKFLTLTPEQYEHYRKDHTVGISEKERNEPEAFHYSTMKNFLMRSQLDAYDPRLPGSGVFDLKSRAVVSVRMHAKDDSGAGYQINKLHGNWQSYEREYVDLVRSAFLKYSLQARMGQMDGIFVAYHNIEQIFGFQYVSLPEMDMAIHGQGDRTLGDREFKLSLNLWDEILDRSIKKFPEQSLRIHFETRDGAIPFMYIFVEPMSEEEIDQIQSKTTKEIEEYAAKITSTSLESSPADEDGQSLQDSNEESLQSGLVSDLEVDADLSGTSPISGSTTPESADEIPPKPVLGFTLVIRNMVNDEIVQYPKNLSSRDKWEIEYNLAEMKEDQVHSTYQACRRRRDMAFPDDEGDRWTATSFMRHIKCLVNQGKSIRRKEIEEMKQNGIKVLRPEFLSKQSVTALSPAIITTESPEEPPKAHSNSSA